MSIFFLLTDEIHNILSMIDSQSSYDLLLKIEWYIIIYNSGINGNDGIL